MSSKLKSFKDFNFSDDFSTKYDIKTQRIDEMNVLKRNRYYQGMIALDRLDKGAKYNNGHRV